jgi:hypothetical protein
MPRPSHRQYSPDGAWWWTGSEWIPAADIWKPRPASQAPTPRRPWGPGLPRRRLMVLAATVLAVLLAVAAGGLAWPALSRPQPSPSPRGLGDGSISALTRSLQTRGHLCSRSALVAAPEIWMCFRDVSPLEEYVVAQSAGGDRLGAIVIRIDQLDFSRPVHPSREQTLEFFRAVVADAFPAATAGPIRAWAERVAGTQTAADTVGGDQVSEFTFSGGSELEVDVGQTIRQYTAFDEVSVPVAADTVRTYLETRGLTCRIDQGFDYCQLDQPSVHADAGIQHNQTAPTVWLLDLLIHAGTASQDVSRQVHLWFAGLERLVFHGADASRVADWISSHLEKRWHRLVIDGVQLTLLPIRPGDWTTTGIWGMQLQVEVARWP